MRITIPFIVLLVVSCNLRTNQLPEGFKITSGLKNNVNINIYSSLIDRALKGDSIAFERFLSLPFHDGIVLDHSWNVCHLVTQIGKERVCSWITEGVIDYEKINRIMRFSGFVYFSDEQQKIFFTEKLKLNCDLRTDTLHVN